MRYWNKSIKQFVQLDQFDIDAEREHLFLLRGFKLPRPKSYSNASRLNIGRNVTNRLRQGKNGKQVCLNERKTVCYVRFCMV